jgi:hypothetical protein
MAIETAADDGVDERDGASRHRRRQAQEPAEARHEDMMPGRGGGAPVPRWFSAGVIFGAFAMLAVLERRRRVEPPGRHDARDFVMPFGEERPMPRSPGGIRSGRPAPGPASLASPPTFAASRASTAGTPDRSRPPLAIKLAGTAYVLVLVPIYWRQYGPGNFLWFSDLALFALCAALWLDGSLLVGMTAIGVLALEIAWSIDFLSGGRLLQLADYMFDASKPFYLRTLSLFHLAIPPAILWMLHRRGYDRGSLARQTALAWVVMPVTYALTDPEKNINWVFGPGTKPQHAVSPRLYLAALMAVVPLLVYLPTHLVLARVFRPPAAE